MSDVTLMSLQKLGACSSARVSFAAQFPLGASYRELLLALADHTQGIEWWEWLAPRVPEFSPALEAYKAAKRTALEAYKAVERPALEAYKAAKRQTLRTIAESFPA